MFRRIARELLRYPRLCYGVRGIQMRVRPPRHDLPPLRSDVERYAPLFVGAEREFVELLRPWEREFTWSVGRTNNGTFESVDIELYHAVLRTYRPDLVIEIGGGHSSRISTEALKRNGGGRVVLVDPRPRVRVPPAVEHVQARVEHVGIALLERLRRNDVLFIDSSHTTDEARYHVGEILPRLASGVIVHHHDLLFPYDAAYLGDPETYGEQDVVLEFYESHRDTYEILVGAAWVLYRNRALLEGLVDSYRWQPDRVPGSLWARKIA